MHVTRAERDGEEEIDMTGGDGGSTNVLNRTHTTPENLGLSLPRLPRIRGRR
jgi:hypothetical protein